MRAGDMMYRYVETHYAEASDDSGWSHGPDYTTVSLNEYPIIRVTPKGVFIDLMHPWTGDGMPTLKFILLGARKRFACPSVQEAADSFKARKRRQIQIYLARVSDAQRALQALEVTISAASSPR